MDRDTSRDGQNWFKTQLGRHRWLWRWVQRNGLGEGCLNRLLNWVIINRAIEDIPARPHPLSCASGYPTWEGLTNRRWSGRHLPPKPAPRDLPAAIDVAQALFARPEGTMIESEKSTLLFPYFAQWFTDGFLAADQVDRRRNYSKHDIDLSQLYGLNPESTKLIREFRGGRLKSQTLNGGEFPHFLYDGKGQIKPEFRRRRTTYEDFADIGAQPLHVVQKRCEMGPSLRENPLIFPDYTKYAEPPDPARPDYSPKMPSHLLYNELRVGEPMEIFKKWQPDWFAMANDRANSTPAFVMMNVLMLREHNRLAGELAKAEPQWDDERLFQTARNILTVIVLRLVIEEYINHITPYHFRFFVDPTSLVPTWFRLMKWRWTNWMTVEFNMLYRWHSMIPGALHLGDPQPIDSMDTLWNTRLVIEKGLASMFNHTSAQRAGRIGPKNTWDHLVAMAEAPTIQMGRDAEVATYNDYREMCGLPRATDFNQISSDPAVQEALRKLYGNVERIEFYPGMFCEDLRENSALAPLVGIMVGIDAFSQALTNPLLQPRVFCEATFGRLGWKIIHQPQSMQELVRRNTPEHRGDYAVTMTRPDWQHR